MIEKGGDSKNVKRALELPRIAGKTPQCGNTPQCEPDYLKPTEQELYTIQRVMWLTRHLSTKRENSDPKTESLGLIPNNFPATLRGGQGDRGHVGLPPCKLKSTPSGVGKLLPIKVVAPKKVIPDTYKCNVLDIQLRGLPPIPAKVRAPAIVRFVRRAESKIRSCEILKRSARIQEQINERLKKNGFIPNSEKSYKV